VNIASAIYKPVDNVILSEAKNLRPEMFRFAQHDNVISRRKSIHAS
jgi:hypothetical protein